jgi:hypothetical protein
MIGHPSGRKNLGGYFGWILKRSSKRSPEQSKFTKVSTRATWIRDAFGDSASHGVIVKTYSVTHLVKEAQGRYARGKFEPVPRDRKDWYD